MRGCALIGILMSSQLLAPSVVLCDGSISPEVLISSQSTAECRTPRVAYNWEKKEYVVVWENDPSSATPSLGVSTRDIYGRLRSFVNFAVTNTPAEPDVAYGAANDYYLLVWREDDSSAGTSRDVHGLLFPWNIL